MSLGISIITVEQLHLRFDNFFECAGKHEIQEIAERLNIKPREDLVNAAHRFYTVGFMICEQ